MFKIVRRIFELCVIFLCVVGLVSCGDTAASENEVKVGFIYIGVPGDEGFTYAHDQGRIEAEAMLKEENITMTSAVIESIADTDADATTSAIDRLITQGCEVIFTTSFGYMDPTLEAAAANPDVKFMHCSGYKTSENMSNYFGKIYQERYLCGIVAGMKFNEMLADGTLSKEQCKVGYEGAFPIAEVVRGIDAFTLGLHSVCSFATVEVKYTSTWYDPTTEYSVAKSLINDGCHILMQHQDTTKPQVAAEEAYSATGDVFSIGYHSDMAFRAPNSNLCSAVWNFGDYYAKEIKAVYDNTWTSESYWGGIEDGVVDLVFNEDNKNLPAGVVEAVAAAKQEIIDGKVIFSGKIELESNKDSEGALIDGVTEENGSYFYDCGTGLTDSYLSSTIAWYVKGVSIKA